MGLAEKRAVKEFETKSLPELKKKLEEAAHMPIELEVKWDTLAQEGMAHLYAECWPQVYFQPVTEAFIDITRDEMGSDALKGALKKVVFQNTANNYYADSCAKFEDGVLTIDHEPTSNVGDVKQRATAITKLLESKL